MLCVCGVFRSILSNNRENRDRFWVILTKYPTDNSIIINGEVHDTNMDGYSIYPDHIFCIPF